KALAFYVEFAKRNEFEPWGREATARAFRRAGDICDQLSRHSEAQANYHKAIGLFVALVADIPGQPEFQSELATSYNNLAISLLKFNQPTEAERALRTALGLKEKLVASFGADANYHGELSPALGNLAELLRETKRPDEAKEAWGRAVKLYQ